MKTALLITIILSCQFKHSHASFAQVMQSTKELRDLEQLRTSIYNVPVSYTALCTTYNSYRSSNPQATLEEFVCHIFRDLQTFDHAIKIMQSIKLMQLASQAHALTLTYLSPPLVAHYSATAAAPLQSLSPHSAASPSRPAAISPIPSFAPVPRLQISESPSAAIPIIVTNTLPSSANSPT